MLRRLIVRDAAIALITALAWIADAHLRAERSPLAIGVGVLTGLLTGLCGYVAHEWGHLAASLATGSVVHYPSLGQSKLSFHFDSAANSRAQFFWMSGGGYLASVLGTIIIVALVPHRSWSGWIAMLVAAAGAVVTLAVEVPITVRVARGAPLPTGFAYETPH